MLPQKKSLPFSFILFLSLTISGCDEEILAPNATEENLIGTWVLTKIIASDPFGQREITPEEEQLAITIIINSDKTYKRNQNSKGEITNDNGTWSVTDGVLTVVSSSGTYSFPCRINGNILETTATTTDPNSGNSVPVTLEFTKQ